MYILFGQSIENGMTFIGPYETEAEVRDALADIDFDETYENLAMDYRFKIIDLHSSPNIAQELNDVETQVI